METRPGSLTVAELVELRRNDVARPNPEYQRGVVWTRHQQMRLIDSVLRGYHLPVIYLHDIQKTVAGRRQEFYEIIDGQQRIQSLYLFAENAFPLYQANDERARFPRFLQSQPCPWGGKQFGSLPDDLKERFMDTRLPVAFIESDDENEIRDLFVRLQAGSSLNAQEKRDANPGNFAEFILRLGGKPDIPRFQGHDFFKRVLRMNPSKDRGKTRQLAAQLAILFLERREKGPHHFSDINANAIDNYYYTNLDFDPDTSDCRRLLEILDLLDSLFGNGKRPPLRAHDAIHLVLFVDTIMDDYAPGWLNHLAPAQDKFSGALAESSVNQKNGMPDDFWNYYGVWTRSNSDRGDNIRRRHRFYSQKMMEFCGQLKLIDPNRLFGPLERELIYWRHQGNCAVCKQAVHWDEAEIHHLEEHSQGGKTVLENGVLVHRQCHPKGHAAQEFAEKYGQNNEP